MLSEYATQHNRPCVCTARPIITISALFFKGGVYAVVRWLVRYVLIRSGGVEFSLNAAFVFPAGSRGADAAPWGRCREYFEKEREHMNRPLRFLVLALACVLLLGAAALAAGSSYTKEITASYSGISLVVDGIPVVPKDANGNVVEPFIYEGTAYLPVRAVGEALGKPVSWDGATRTVYVGQKPGEVQYLLDVCPPYEKTGQFKQPDQFEMMGERYGHGFTLRDSSDQYAIFNLNGEYQSLEFDVGHVDGSLMYDGSFKIYLDGEYAQTIEVSSNMIVTHMTIPLNYAIQLKIKGTNGQIRDDPVYGFANAILS